MPTTCNTCAMKPNCLKDKPCELLKPKFGKIKHVVGVISGKGGVGKSSVTGLLAVALTKLGKSVGVLDADITGPSIPRFFGVEQGRSGYIPTEDPEVMMMAPMVSRLGIRLQSMNFLIEEEQPVMWRGPILSNALVQLFQETEWGELDYLLIDMPPGTGDVAISIMTQFPVDYFVVVSTPQNMVTMIVNKIVNMIKTREIPIKGVIQNMAYFKCDECSKKHYIFSQNPSSQVAEDMGLELLCELPLDPAFTRYLEEGQAEQYAHGNPEYDVLMEAFLSDEEEIMARNKANKKKSIPLF
ncbi:Mrp/NBP35 family ATP-binding protein [Clostridiaceae bacterium HFYG-1003]|nr:Mrp/NBP35 family ATP-binding protein [Clostridiaceae bacterium HFYG-1003]